MHQFVSSYLALISATAGVPLILEPGHGGLGSTTKAEPLSPEQEKACNTPPATQYTCELPCPSSCSASPVTVEASRLADVGGKGRGSDHGFEGWSSTRMKETRPLGLAATTTSDGVMASWPMCGYRGRQSVALSLVTCSEPAGIGARLGTGTGPRAPPYSISDEVGVRTKVVDWTVEVLVLRTGSGPIYVRRE